MELEKRVTNLENMLASVMKNISNNKYYTDADVAGVRQGVENITPYTETKKAYIDDTELVFENVPSGNLTVYFDKDYQIEKEGNRVTLHFEALEAPTDITISII